MDPNKVIMSKADEDRLALAQALTSLTNNPAYQTYLKPFLVNLAQEGYPDPSEYQNNEKLILDYTKKVGETHAVKEIIQFLESQSAVVEAINKKYSEGHNEEFKI